MREREKEEEKERGHSFMQSLTPFVSF